MAVITKHIIVPDIAIVIPYFDEIRVYRSLVSSLGPYVEVSTSLTRPQLEPTQVTYEFTDLDGEPTYYYRTSFFNTTTSEESAFSEPQLGVGDPALEVLSVLELQRDFLTGVPLFDASGAPFSNETFVHYIRAAVAYVEHRLDIPLRPLVIRDEMPEEVDFIRQDYNKWIALQLKNKPIISVQSITLVLPTEQVVISYDSTWMQLDNDAGSLHIVPGSGQLALGISGGWLPMLYGWVDFLPNVFRVAYTAGFARGQIPADLKHLVGLYAALGPLAIAGDIVGGVGVAGERVGLDALMTEFKTARTATSGVFGGRIAQYQLEIAEMLKELRRSFQGIRLVIG